MKELQSPTMKDMAIRRRLDALFRVMASDYLLREQFVTDPAQITCDYVLGARMPEQQAARVNHMIYSVAANRGLLRWLRVYGLKHGLAFKPEQFLKDFGHAVVEHQGQHVVLALLSSAAVKGETTVASSGSLISSGSLVSSASLMSILAGLLGRQYLGDGVTGGPPTGGPPVGGPPVGGPPTGGPPVGGPPVGGPPVGGPPVGGPPVGGPPTGGPPVGGPPVGGPPVGGPPTGGPPNQFPFFGDYFDTSIEALSQYATNLANSGALDNIGSGAFASTSLNS